MPLHPTVAPTVMDSTPILIVEDDEDLARLIRMHLADSGYDATVATGGKQGLGLALDEAFRLVILDVMLPEMDGFEVCRQLRAAGSRVPVLMLTSRSEEIDKVLGLELGADDYLTKPFSVRELQARVKALLRRAEMSPPAEDASASAEMQFGDLVIYPARRAIEIGGGSVDLTAKEFDLLLLFARNPGRAYSRKDLLDQVWGYQYEGYSHTVNTHINRLRAKLGDDPSEPRFIKTVWGHGYRFIEPAEAAS
jgi:two-component system, OmpR family, alkaline phosphatase synthesis response regulator PhoP